MIYKVPCSASETVSKYGLITAALGLAIITVVIGISHNLADVLHLADVLLIGPAAH